MFSKTIRHSYESIGPTVHRDGTVNYALAPNRTQREIRQDKPRVTRTPNTKSSNWYESLNNKYTRRLAYLAITATAVHSYTWSGDKEVGVDNCTSETHQQVVVSTPFDGWGVGRSPLRKIYEAAGYSSSSTNGVAPRTLTGLVNSLQGSRGYVISPQQFMSQNEKVTSKSGKRLFGLEDGKISKSFDQDGVYCVDVPAPIRSGVHLVTESRTTIEDLATSYKLPVEKLYNLNPDLKNTEPSESLPEGATIAISESQGDLVLQEADTEAMNEYLTLPSGHFDPKEWKRIAWHNRAYSGITAIEPNEDLMYMPFAANKSKKLGNSALNAAKNSFYENNESVSPVDVLNAYPNTPIGLPVLEINQKSDNNNRADKLSRDQNVDKEVPDAGIESRDIMKRQLESYGVPAEFSSLYIKYGNMYNISPFLIAAKDKQESNWDPDALNAGSKAAGLGQAVPGTWRHYKDLGVIPNHANPYDPEMNVKGNTWYLRNLLDRVMSADYSQDALALTLAAYNAGPGNVFNKYHGIPPFSETNDYIKQIASTLKSWGHTEMTYQGAIGEIVTPAMFEKVSSPPDNPIERQAYYANKLGISMNDIVFSSPNGLYQFDIKREIGEKILDISPYGGYPEKWRTLPAKSNNADDWSMYVRECTSYASWRVNQLTNGKMPAWGGRDNQPNTTGHQGGDAMYWVGNAKAEGIRVDSKPEAGAVIAWSREGVEHNWKGHVAVIEKLLKDGSVIVSQYNNGGNGDFSIEILSAQYMQYAAKQMSIIHTEML